MLMTERFSLDCREFQYLLWEDEIPRFLEALGSASSAPSLRRDEWRMTTVYLDRPDGFFARGALASPGTHVELRLREYFTPAGDSLSPFVWVESKDQEGNVSRLNRFQLHRNKVGRFLNGELESGEVLEDRERSVEPKRLLQAVRAVRAVAGRGPLVAAGAVSSLRLAIEGGTPLARLTLDREISYHVGPLRLDPASLGRDSLGAAALEEKAGVVEIKYRGSRHPAWCGRVLVPAGPVEYSKFLFLSALVLSDRMVKRTAGERSVLELLPARAI